MSEHYDNGLHMMEKQGGSFVKSLAHCYYMADQENRRKLREAFASYFDKYERHYSSWRLNRPKAHCKDHARYASDCGGCFHAEANRGAA